VLHSSIRLKLGFQWNSYNQLGLSLFCFRSLSLLYEDAATVYTSTTAIDSTKESTTLLIDLSKVTAGCSYDKPLPLEEVLLLLLLMAMSP
jgi:hypothetical protein